MSATCAHCVCLLGAGAHQMPLSELHQVQSLFIRRLAAALQGMQRRACHAGSCCKSLAACNWCLLKQLLLYGPWVKLYLGRDASWCASFRVVLKVFSAMPASQLGNGLLKFAFNAVLPLQPFDCSHLICASTHAGGTCLQTPALPH